jgi:hypothetical protein
VIEVVDAILSHWTGRQLSLKEAHEVAIYRQIEMLKEAPPPSPADLSQRVP